jgi:Gly-Xaa carboxypeptidase
VGKTAVEQLPLAVSPPPSSSPSRSRQLAALLFLVPAAFWLTVSSGTALSYLPGCSHHNKQALLTSAALAGAVCPVQPEPLNVGVDWKPEDDAEYVKKAVERLQGAVRIVRSFSPVFSPETAFLPCSDLPFTHEQRTESFDDMAGPEDPRFEVMKSLHEYLEKTYPRVYEVLQVDKIATYGILATWKGKDESLKPVVRFLILLVA